MPQINWLNKGKPQSIPWTAPTFGEILRTTADTMRFDGGDGGGSYDNTQQFFNENFPQYLNWANSQPQSQMLGEGSVQSPGDVESGRLSRAINEGVIPKQQFLDWINKNNKDVQGWIPATLDQQGNFYGMLGADSGPDWSGMGVLAALSMAVGGAGAAGLGAGAAGGSGAVGAGAAGLSELGSASALSLGMTPSAFAATIPAGSALAGSAGALGNLYGGAGIGDAAWGANQGGGMDWLDFSDWGSNTGFGNLTDAGGGNWWDGILEEAGNFTGGDSFGGLRDLSELGSPTNLQDMITRFDSIPNLPSGLKQLAQSLFASGDSGGLSRLLGQLGAAGLGAYASNQQADQYGALASRYEGYGAPSRARYEASYGPGFTMGNDPGYMDAMNQASKANLHGLSTTFGNPALSPTAQAANMSDLYQKTAYPALQNYRLGNSSAGGLQSAAAVAPQLSAQAIGQNANTYNAVGAGLNSIFNPQPTLMDIVTAMRGGR